MNAVSVIKLGVFFKVKSVPSAAYLGSVFKELK